MTREDGMQDRDQGTNERRPTPLDGVRVIDMAEGKGEMCGRFLADLGADVIRVEPPGGAASRMQAPLHDRVSLHFATHNAGKRGVVVDHTTSEGRERLLALLESADIWIETTSPGALSELGLGAAVVRGRNPGLVILSITDFGQTGPYCDWVATDWTLLAMGGVLSRSGLPGREPLMPPGDMALQVTAMQAAWAALVAYWNRLECGLGDHIDFSLYEATAQVIDPAMGTVGTAQAAGYEDTRGRPAPGPYPIFRCRDGHVRVVLLAPRQWQAMRAWLGEPAELQDPELETIRGRALASERLHAGFERFFRERGKHELTLEGQGRGVPIAPVLTPADVLAAEHFRARGAIAHTELAPGIAAAAPTGFAEIDGRRVRSGRCAPGVGEHDHEVFAEPARSSGGVVANAGPTRRPLDGLRVLDFGVIVLGAEAARLFCELGAEVIKIESRAFPDGARISPVHFAIGHRGSKGLGVNLRSPDGVDVVRRLVARSDVLLANFKPGTLDKLGLGAHALQEINPGIVVVNSSAVGATGPWSAWMGYGPLVRCASGLSSLWRYPDDHGSFSDSTTIHPDHYAARVTAITALAALIGRRRSGLGAQIATSQAETLLVQIGKLLVEEALRPGAIQATGNVGRHAAPWGVYPCAGEDEWCVVTVRDDDDWRRLRGALGDPDWAAGNDLATTAGRLARRADIDEQLTAWTRERPPREVMATLQAAGVPAGFMQRAADFEDDPQLQVRDFLRTFEQPGLEPLRIDNAPFRSERIPLPANSPAPEPGEHTREICTGLLGMDADEVDRLIDGGVLEEPVQSADPGQPALPR
jgi:crotonobetainyl-CoA:carnitine CoA-transferase CaiB-like acyl-CoA transferase